MRIIVCAFTIASLTACAGASQQKMQEMEERLALQDAQLKAFRDEVRGDIKELKGKTEEIATAQRSLETKQKELADAAPVRPTRPRGPDPQAVYAIKVGEAKVKGKSDAWVTVIEVSDFQCPFCKRVNPTLAQIRDKYGDDVRIAFKHNPLSFHKRALPAALAAECAGDQNKFWKMHDVMFENQRDLEDDDLDRYASEIQLNMKRFRRCIKEETHKPRILGDQKYAVSFGARGTPAFFINGRYLSGAQPFPAFQALIDEELEKAKKSGIARGEYYEKAVVAKGKSSL
ncbi:MAG: thioredoxin domain-containing protein [Myxococcota bacterium]